MKQFVLKNSGLLLLVTSVMIATMVIVVADQAFLSKDAAQYIGVARNLLDGNGISSDLIYYDTQYLSGRIPTPETVFPPGVPLTIAALELTGLDGSTALVVANAMALAFIPVLIYAILVRLTFNRQMALFLSAFHLILMMFWSFTVQGRSEPIFTFLTVLCLWGITLRQTSGRYSQLYILLASASGCAAALTRYQGLFFIFAVGLVLGIRWLRKPNYSSFLDLLVIGAIPVLVIAAMFVRNYSISGNWSGGPLVSVDYSGTFLNVVFGLYWQISNIFGISLGGLRDLRIVEVLLAMTIVALSVFFVDKGRVPQKPEIKGRTRKCNWVLACCCSYIAVSVIGLAWLGVARSSDYIQARFLITLAPFLIVLLAIVYHKSASRAAQSKKVTALLAIFFALLMAGQLRVIEDQSSVLESRSATHNAISSALSHQMPQGGTVKQFLQAAILGGKRVFAEESLITGLVLNSGTIGAAPSRFSDTTIDDARIRCLASTYGIRYVVFYPKLFDSSAEANIRKTIFQNISKGMIPEWLEPNLIFDDLQLFSISLSVECDDRR